MLTQLREIGPWQKAATGGGPLRAAFEEIAKRRGRKIAKVANRPPHAHPSSARSK
jgi:hypothetical protein